MNAIGIDVSKGKSTVAVLRPFGEIVLTPFDTTHSVEDLKALISKLSSIEGESRVVMEYTGNYHAPIANGSHIIFLNSKYSISNVSKPVEEFLGIVNGMPEDAFETEFAGNIFDKISSVKSSSEMEDAFMTLGELYDIERRSGYDDGYGEGYGEGYRKGQIAGQEAGFKNGQEAGLKTGREAGFKTGQEAGFKTGQEAGFKTGQEAGFKTGREAGREEGMKAGENKILETLGITRDAYEKILKEKGL